MGSVVHKILEILSHRCDFKDETGSYKYPFNVEKLCEQVFKYYESKRTDWEKYDITTIKDWVNTALTLDDGAYDPRTLDVLEAEKHFDITIEHDWAHYEFNTPQGPLKGQLSIKGTMDLVLNGDGCIELLDWKTGQRKNWATGKIKEYEDLRKDSQLLLYYYVARKIYNKPILVTIVYINHGGAYTIAFDDDDFEHAENMLREKFEYIKTTKPTPIYPAQFCRFCTFSKTYYPEPIVNGGKPLNKCLHIHQELVQIGQYNTVKKYMLNDGKHLTKYGEGGGVSTEAREKKNESNKSKS